MSRVTVVGAGFAALTAVRKLRAADPKLTIDLVAPKPEFVYYPGTIWIPTGLREPQDLVIPLDNFFRRHRVDYHRALGDRSARGRPGTGDRPGANRERWVDHRQWRTLHP
jgi:NADPH-dependent 2,4-dienoyl-CoA reductase/sulfur reductase-like enzyme